MSAELLNSALELWRRGFSVISVPRPDAHYDGKTPAIRWAEFQERRPTEDEIRRWFKLPCNIAVVTGRISGVVVIDADSPQAVRWATRKFPYTPWQTKTARGFHLWYRHPGVVVRNRASLCTLSDGRIAVDVRADGGYVIAAGSVTSDPSSGTTASPSQAVASCVGTGRARASALTRRTTVCSTGREAETTMTTNTNSGSV